MRFKSLFLVMALALLALPFGTLAHAAGWAITANGGTSIPTGDFGDENKFNAETGWNIGGAVDYSLNDMWAVGIDGSWNQNAHGGEGEVTDLGGGDTYSLDEDQFKTWQIGAHGKFMFPVGTNPLKPYGLLGLGIYNTKEEWTETYTLSGVATTTSDEATTDSRFGGKVGLGATWMANQMWGFGVEADYNFISEDEAKSSVSSLQYAGVRGAVNFKIPSSQAGK